MMRVSELKELTDMIEQISTHAKHVKYLVIDDYTHYFNRRIFSPKFMAQNTGGAVFERWNVFGADVFNTFWSKADKFRGDLTIIVNHHTSPKDDGTIGFKTAGKLLDDKIDCPSEVEYIFHTRVLEGSNGAMSYKFMTNTDGIHEAKTPMGMFKEQFIDNDIYAAIQVIDAYEFGEVAPATQQ
jgi:hypothetical protein